MLPKKNRIISKDFRKLKFFKRSAFSGRLSIKMKEGNPNNPSKFGFVVSNKISKKATDRNALKRKLRAIAWGMLPSVGRGKEIIVFVKSPFTKPYDYIEIRDELEHGIANLNIVDVKKNNH